LPPLALRLLLHLSVLGQAPAACRAVSRAAAPANSDGPPLAPQLARGFAIQLAALAAPPYSREVHNAIWKAGSFSPDTKLWDSGRSYNTSKCPQGFV
jgi:hypothetical protein